MDGRDLSRDLSNGKITLEEGEDFLNNNSDDGLPNIPSNSDSDEDFDCVAPSDNSTWDSWKKEFTQNFIDTLKKLEECFSPYLFINFDQNTQQFALSLFSKQGENSITSLIDYLSNSYQLTIEEKKEFKEGKTTFFVNKEKFPSVITHLSKSKMTEFQKLQNEIDKNVGKGIFSLFWSDKENRLIFVVEEASLPFLNAFKKYLPEELINTIIKCKENNDTPIVDFSYEDSEFLIEKLKEYLNTYHTPKKRYAKKTERALKKYLVLPDLSLVWDAQLDKYICALPKNKHKNYNEFWDFLNKNFPKLGDYSSNDEEYFFAFSPEDIDLFLQSLKGFSSANQRFANEYHCGLQKKFNSKQIGFAWHADNKKYILDLDEKQLALGIFLHTVIKNNGKAPSEQTDLKTFQHFELTPKEFSAYYGKAIAFWEQYSKVSQHISKVDEYKNNPALAYKRYMQGAVTFYGETIDGQYQKNKYIDSFLDFLDTEIATYNQVLQKQWGTKDIALKFVSAKITKKRAIIYEEPRIQFDFPPENRFESLASFLKNLNFDTDNIPLDQWEDLIEAVHFFDMYNLSFKEGEAIKEETEKVDQAVALYKQLKKPLDIKRLPGNSTPNFYLINAQHNAQADRLNLYVLRQWWDKICPDYQVSQDVQYLIKEEFSLLNTKSNVFKKANIERIQYMIQSLPFTLQSDTKKSIVTDNDKKALKFLEDELTSIDNRKVIYEKPEKLPSINYFSPNFLDEKLNTSKIISPTTKIQKQRKKQEAKEITVSLRKLFNDKTISFSYKKNEYFFKLDESKHSDLGEFLLAGANEQGNAQSITLKVGYLFPRVEFWLNYRKGRSQFDITHATQCYELYEKWGLNLTEDNTYLQNQFGKNITLTVDNNSEETPRVLLKLEIDYRFSEKDELRLNQFLLYVANFYGWDSTFPEGFIPKKCLDIRIPFDQVNVLRQAIRFYDTYKATTKDVKKISNSYKKLINSPQLIIEEEGDKSVISSAKLPSDPNDKKVRSLIFVRDNHSVSESSSSVFFSNNVMKMNQNNLLKWWNKLCKIHGVSIKEQRLVEIEMARLQEKGWQDIEAIKDMQKSIDMKITDGVIKNTAAIRQLEGVLASLALNMQKVDNDQLKKEEEDFVETIRSFLSTLPLSAWTGVHVNRMRKLLADKDHHVVNKSIQLQQIACDYIRKKTIGRAWNELFHSEDIMKIRYFMKLTAKTNIYGNKDSKTLFSVDQHREAALELTESDEVDLSKYKIHECRIF